MKLLSSLCLLSLTVLVSVQFTSAQFGRNKFGRSNRVNRRICNTCDIDPTTEYPSNPNPSVPGARPVNFLEVAETCAASFITQDYDNGWEERIIDPLGVINGVPLDKWLNRLTNKLFVYLMAFNMYESNGLDITDSQMRHSSCFVTTNVNGWSITNTTGFGGKSMVLRLARTNLPKVFRFALPYGPLGASTGTASIVLSDSKTYNIFEFCFDNGLRTFAMFGKNVEEKDIEAAKVHLKAIGFNEKHFLDLDPDFWCENRDGIPTVHPSTGELDLPRPRPISPQLIKFIGHNNLFPAPPLFWKKK